MPAGGFPKNVARKDAAGGNKDIHGIKERQQEERRT